MTPLLIVVFVATFALAIAAVLGARYVANRKDEPARPVAMEQAEEETEAAEDLFDWLTPVHAPQILREDTLSAISIWSRMLNRFDWAGRLKSELAEAGMTWTVGRLVAMIMLGGAAMFALAWKMSWVPTPVAVALGAVAAAGPYTMVLRRRTQRLNRIEAQFPDALDSLARSMRAGNPFMAAMTTLARETPQPLAAEFRRTVNEMNMGRDWDRALEHLAERVPIEEVSVFVASVQLQSRSGGKLHEVLAKIGETMREQHSLRGEIRSIAAHGKLTGLILTMLPLVIAGLLTYVNPTHLLILWNHPVGNLLIWAAGAALLASHFVIRRLVDVRI